MLQVLPGRVASMPPMLLLLLLLLLPLVESAQSTAPSCNLTIFPDTSCTQAAFAWTNATNFPECCADCAAHPLCAACEWMGSEGSKPRACHLKTEPGSKIAQEGTTCGVSKELPPPPPPRYTPCSYSLVHDSGVAAALHLAPTKNQMYTAQADCDAHGRACGGWSVVNGAAFLVAPFTQRDVTVAPAGSLLYAKHCGPWVDPPSLPTVWPLPAAVSTGNATAVLAADFLLHSDSTSSLLGRALTRFTALIFTHAAAAAPSTASATALTGLRVVVASASDDLSLGVDENYTLTIPASCGPTPPCEGTLYSNSVFGALRGLETFAQLVRFDFEEEVHSVPGAPVVISDAPRFAYRGESERRLPEYVNVVDYPILNPTFQ